MPELAEVEATRSWLESLFLGCSITNISISGTVTKVVAATDAEFSALLGAKILAIKRRGKHLWFEFEGIAPVLHFQFGMTGGFVIPGETTPYYRGFQATDPPTHPRLEISLDNTKNLIYCDHKCLGRITTTLDEMADLAPDPLLDPPITPEEFKAKFGAKRSSVKVVLMNQESVVCGLGNWLCDDICLRAGILPRTQCNKLSDAQINALISAIYSLVNEAVACGGDGRNYPTHWLYHARWDKTEKQTATLPTGELVKFEKIGGRLTAYCPSLQGGSREDDSLEAEMAKAGINDDE